jgi:hypothetical protein
MSRLNLIVVFVNKQVSNIFFLQPSIFFTNDEVNIIDLFQKRIVYFHECIAMLLIITLRYRVIGSISGKRCKNFSNLIYLYIGIGDQ